MSVPQDLLTDVASALDSVSGLRTHSTVPGTVKTPAAVCEIAQIRAPAQFGTVGEYTVRVTLMVQAGDQRNAQERLYTLIDPAGTTSASAFAALLSYTPANQVVFEGPGTIEFGGDQFAGGIFTVTVFA